MDMKVTIASRDGFVDSREFARMTRAIEFIEREFERQPRLAEIARHVGLSEFHFNRLFRRWTGLTPKQYLAEVTSRAARPALRAEPSVMDAAHSVGLSGGGRLHDLTVTLEAMTPGEIRAAGEGVVIRHGVASTPFGSAFVAETAAGFMPPGFRRRWLERRHGTRRAARLVAEGRIRSRRRACAELVAHRIWGRGKAATFPLAVSGTNFQVQVWRALLELEPAETVTYGALARKLGKPDSCASRWYCGGRESDRLGHPLPSRLARGRRTRRLSLGRGPQTDDSPLGRKARRGVITF